MPTIIAIESHPVEFQGVDTGFDHLYLVRTVTNPEGQILSETVIRGGLGPDRSLTIQAGIPLALSEDSRGGDTPAERHQRILDLGDRSPNDVWNVMLQHARNVERADLPYGFDFAGQVDGDDVNSNTLVASVLNSVGISLAQNLPPTVSRSEVPLYDQVGAMTVNDVLKGTTRGDRILGGTADDRLYGASGNDSLVGERGNDLIVGGWGSDRILGSSGHDTLSGGGADDVLSGGSGLDAFVFSSEISGGSNIDRVTDFSVRDDTLWLSNQVFDEVGREGRLNSTAFWTGAVAHDATDRIIYDRASGALYYDPDGTGLADQTQFARLTASLKITAADFLIT